MGREVDLMINYPRSKRNVEERGATKTEEDRNTARQFEKDFLMEIAKQVMEDSIITLDFGILLSQRFKSFMV